MNAYQTNLVMFVLIVRIPTEGIEDFRASEEAVLPLLPEFNGEYAIIDKAPVRSVERRCLQYPHLRPLAES